MAAVHLVPAPARGIDAGDGPWLAVQIWAGREHATADHLRARGCDVFLPQRRDVRIWSDRRKSIVRPLFPGYAFCRATADTYGRIVTTPGVLRLVGGAGGPSPVPVEEIDAIQRLVASELAIEPLPRFHPGQRVVIACGPLRGIHGVVITTKHSRRLVLSVTLLQRSVAVTLDPGWVSTIDASSRLA